MAGFYASGESNESITVDSLEVYGPGAPDDAVLSEGDEAKERLFLPFRIDSDTQDTCAATAAKARQPATR